MLIFCCYRNVMFTTMIIVHNPKELILSITQLLAIFDENIS